MKNYKLVFDYQDLGGNGDWQIFKKTYILGVIPSEWEIQFYTPVEEIMATWIDDNVKDQSERVQLKTQLFDKVYYDC